MTNSTISAEKLKALYAQIEQIYDSFKSIRGEAEGILVTSDMPDSKMQLGDVLESTENATMAIITHVSAIGGLISDSALPDAQKHEVEQHVSKVYEACSFQDISGQRIKKVISRLQVLEEQLQRLSDFTHDKGVVTPVLVKDSLLNGPQLNSIAPDQQDIDRMFKE